MTELSAEESLSLGPSGGGGTSDWFTKSLVDFVNVEHWSWESLGSELQSHFVLLCTAVCQKMYNDSAETASQLPTERSY